MEQLKNPPITEALIDIQATFLTPLTKATVEKQHLKIKDVYPQIQELNKFEFEAKIEIGTGKPPANQLTSEFNGYLFWSADKTQATQFRLNGFAVSRLRPYASGDALIAEAKRIWPTYKNNLNPEKVKRIAMRYINSIPLSVGSNLRDYFPLIASIPDGLAVPIEYYFSQMAYKQTDAHILITHASSLTGADKINHVIDIDVSQDCSLVPNGDDSKIWDIIAKLRIIKNNVFDKYTSSQTKGMFL
ncbi:MAG: TIGR04255 family protein [Nitrospinae bacterium]|nr:TIGR04255 family protein [Nitrospinota bacterium]